MEKGLVLRQHCYGSDSQEVWAACKTVGELCNLLAMTFLQQEDYNMVLELLKKAEILSERDLPGRAVTYNNFACYYRRKGKLHSALQYLQKVLFFSIYMIFGFTCVFRLCPSRPDWTMSKTLLIHTSTRAPCSLNWAAISKLLSTLRVHLFFSKRNYYPRPRTSLLRKQTGSPSLRLPTTTQGSSKNSSRDSTKAF